MRALPRGAFSSTPAAYRPCMLVLLLLLQNKIRDLHSQMADGLAMVILTCLWGDSPPEKFCPVDGDDVPQVTPVWVDLYLRHINRNPAHFNVLAMSDIDFAIGGQTHPAISSSYYARRFPASRVGTPLAKPVIPDHPHHSTALASQCHPLRTGDYSQQDQGRSARLIDCRVVVSRAWDSHIGIGQGCQLVQNCCYSSCGIFLCIYKSYRTFVLLYHIMYSFPRALMRYKMKSLLYMQAVGEKELVRR